MVMVLILIMVWSWWDGLWEGRMAGFCRNWPKYGKLLCGAADTGEGKINGIEGERQHPAPTREVQPGEIRRLELV